MRAVFCHDTYYSRNPETSEIYTYGAFPYNLWKDRFLPHFSHITVIGREKEFDAAEAEKLDKSSGPKVEFVLLPNVNTPLKRIFGSGAVQKKIAEEVKKADALIIRGPVEFGMMAASAARKHGVPYAVEMSGCAFDHTWYHGSLIGKLYAPVKYRRAQKMVRLADYAIYVTKDFLQSRYPCKGVTSYASNVEIEAPAPEVLENRLSRIHQKQDKLVFGLIGNYGNNLKGLGVALEALWRARESLPDFEFRILGHGNRERWMEGLEESGWQDRVIFSGTLPGGDPVLQWLDEIDIYLQPSFHEGLPRAVIEAMSRGCPVLASDAGGTEELLDSQCIHRRGDIDTLAAAIKQALDKRWKKEQAQKNFEVAKNYTRPVLTKRRKIFWTDFAEFVKKSL